VLGRQQLVCVLPAACTESSGAFECRANPVNYGVSGGWEDVCHILIVLSVLYFNCRRSPCLLQETVLLLVLLNHCLTVGITTSGLINI
jgi:hypothetical protein